MAVPTADESARMADEFADIICSDPDWLDAEFEEIVAGFWKAPKTVVASPWAHRNFPAVSGVRLSTGFTVRPNRPMRVDSPIRSPPADGHRVRPATSENF